MRKVIFGIAALILLSAVAVEAQTVERTYYDTGELRFESTYLKGVRHGITREYAKNGNVLHTYRFEDGELVEKLNEGISMELGPLNFLLTPIFWIILVGGGLLTWFLFTKLALRNKPL